MTGMDLVEAIRRGEAAPPSGIATLGLDSTHHWITILEPGRVVFEWANDGRYDNLEGAVICPWLVALADQAMFFASNTLCGEGEGTRMVDLHFRSIHNISGPVTVDAVVIERVGDRCHCECEFRLSDGTLAAHVSALIDVIRA